MKVGEKERIRFRIYIVGLFFLIGLGTILFRAYQLQILRKDDLNAMARSGYIGTKKIPLNRGTIYDRERRELAMNVEVGSIFAHPRQVDDKEITAKKLAGILNRKQGEILSRLKSGRPFVWIERKIRPDQSQMVEAANLKGVYVTSETRRYYPGKESGAQLIGFVGADNQGLEGVEKIFDSYLRAEQDRLIQMRDALGRPFSVITPGTSSYGVHDLILTIDKDIQFKAQEALSSAVEKANARGGNCIVVDPETGEILAMAVAPEFNPNVFAKYGSSQWKNKTVTDCFEPGSTMKAFLLAACLEEGIMTTDTLFDCEQGKYRIGGKIIHDTKKHGIMSVSDIVMYSSNIGAVKMGQTLEYRTFCDYLQKFGFGRRLGEDFLGERDGFIRPPDQTRTIDQATVYFGQGMSCTSLQLVMAMAAIANGGRLMRPYVVKAIVDESGSIVKETRPRLIRRVVSEKTAGKVSWILESVVSAEGTGSRASIAGFRVAGKTGTSQKVDPETKRYSGTKYVGVFVGFMPVDKPELAILVTIDEPKGIHYGGLVAAPVFRDVGQWSLNYLRVNPRVCLAPQEIGLLNNAINRVCRPSPDQIDPNEGIQAEDGTIPDFRGLAMRDVLRKGRSLGLKILPEGTGLAVKQDPHPGASLNSVCTVKVEFTPPR